MPRDGNRKVRTEGRECKKNKAQGKKEGDARREVNTRKEREGRLSMER